jgi:hypothetical protein
MKSQILEVEEYHAYSSPAVFKKFFRGLRAWLKWSQSACPARPEFNPQYCCSPPQFSTIIQYLIQKKSTEYQPHMKNRYQGVSQEDMAWNWQT